MKGEDFPRPLVVLLYDYAIEGMLGCIAFCSASGFGYDNQIFRTAVECRFVDLRNRSRNFNKHQLLISLKCTGAYGSAPIRNGNTFEGSIGKSLFIDNHQESRKHVIRGRFPDHTK